MNKPPSNDNRPTKYVKKAKAKPGPHRKTSSYLSERQVSQAIPAVNLARAINAPLDYVATVHWGLSPSPAHPMDRITKILERYRKFACRRGFTFTWLFSRENGITKGDHVHFGFRVPTKYRAEFSKALEGWVQADADAPMLPGAIHQSPEKYGTPVFWVRYLTKGADKATRRKTLGGKSSYQGRIEGKRFGVSHNIGPTAQAKWNAEKGWASTPITPRKAKRA